MRGHVPFKRSKSCDFKLESKLIDFDDKSNKKLDYDSLDFEDEFNDDSEEFHDELFDAMERAGMSFDEKDGEWEYNDGFNESEY